MSYSFCGLVYTMIGLMGLSLYGIDVKPDVLINITQHNNEDSYIALDIIKVAFICLPLTA